LWIFLRKYPVYSREHGYSRPAKESTLATLPEDLKQLMLDCWKLNADERPTIQQCIDVLTKLSERWESPKPSPFVLIKNKLLGR